MPNSKCFGEKCAFFANPGNSRYNFYLFVIFFHLLLGFTLRPLDTSNDIIVFKCLNFKFLREKSASLGWLNFLY